jgi:hypothetical protein
MSRAKYSGVPPSVTWTYPADRLRCEPSLAHRVSTLDTLKEAFNSTFAWACERAQESTTPSSVRPGASCSGGAVVAVPGGVAVGVAADSAGDSPACWGAAE